MQKLRLGKTDLEVNKIGFGALPIQRRNFDDSLEILKKAYDNGIDFYDTARAYSDSEEKLGLAFSDVRDTIYIASKTMATDVENFWKDLETSLNYLQTDYIDLYQFHNPSTCPKPGDGSGLYEAMLEAKENGQINHIGITSHKYTIAKEAIDSGLYETLQYPLSYLTGDNELELVKMCELNDVGFIAMKAMGGGLIKNSKAAFGFLNEFENVLPIWGIQKESELDEFLDYGKNNVTLNNDEKLVEEIEHDRKELGDEFCRGCGYCMPCPEDIEINAAARMSLWIRRFPTEPCLGEDYQEKMNKTLDCTECRMCVEKCPYDLNIPKLLKENYDDYMKVLNGETKIR
ncbi:MAG: aldo/keto reductase [Methanobrevibacter sp.]|uniref:aldo/keto reductase n=1 Tax=Methanobrevibacter sp. TaxID=66852 RepID=UPI0026DF17AA|nr:aldo/keto reductase [Methanobrevibacter sp.]MDO5848737.1 aldo/keto reductase [Methanobrevibacter sp.]